MIKILKPSQRSQESYKISLSYCKYDSKQKCLWDYYPVYFSTKFIEKKSFFMNAGTVWILPYGIIWIHIFHPWSSSTRDEVGLDLEIQEHQEWSSGCFLWRADSLSWLRYRNTHCKSVNHFISTHRYTCAYKRNSTKIRDISCEVLWRSHSHDILRAGGTIRKEGHAGERMIQQLLWCDAMRGIQMQHCLQHVHKQGQINKFWKGILKMCWSDWPDLKH